MIDDSMVERKKDACPICESPDIRPFMVVGDNGHLRTQQVRLPVYRCKACDIVFLNPAPESAIGAEYFAEAYADGQAANLYYREDFKRRVSELRMGLVEDWRSAPDVLLDLGCGRGTFVGVARSMGWDAWGVELDEGACLYAHRELGLSTVLNGTLTHPGLPSTFGVVTLWDVIEHVPDPVGLLRDVTARLRDGGIVVLRTANVRSRLFDRDPARWWAFGSDHRFYFSPGSLEVALRRAGLKLEAVLNRELMERPGKRREDGIVDTSLAKGVRAVVRAPYKLRGVGRYLRGKWRESRGRRLYGSHYDTSLMTVVARKTAS